MKKHFLLGLVALAICATSMADDWTRVTDVSELRAGDRLVIACPSEGTAAGGLDSSKKILASVSATFSEDEATMTSEGNALVLTLGGEAGKWTLADADGKLLGTTGVRAVVWDAYVHTWTISVSDGRATIESTGKDYGRFLYNKNSPRFTTYTSNTTKAMLLPALYRKSYKEYGFVYEGYPEKTTRCEEIAYAAGTKITLSKGQPTKEGYLFLGWLYDGKTYQPGDVFTMPEGDVVLVAQWKNTGSGIEETAMQEKTTKVIIDNTLYIQVGEVMYDVLGNKH